MIDQLGRLRAEWEQQAEELEGQAREEFAEGAREAALQRLRSFVPPHDLVTAALAELSSIPPPGVEETLSDAEVEARESALTTQAPELQEAFKAWYESLNAAGLRDLWPGAPAERISSLSSAFEDYRAARVQYGDCEYEIEADGNGEIIGSVSNCVQTRLRKTSGHGKRLIVWIDLLAKERRHDHSSQA